MHGSKRDRLQELSKSLLESPKKLTARPQVLQGQLLDHGSQSSANRITTEVTQASEAHREAADLIWLTSPLEVSSDLVICVCDTTTHTCAD